MQDIQPQERPRLLATAEQLKGVCQGKEQFFGCGVYFLMDSNYDVVYVGSSTMVGARVRDHARERTGKMPNNVVGGHNFTFIAVHWCTPEMRFDLERAYIHRFQPKFNRTCTDHQQKINRERSLVMQLVPPERQREVMERMAERFFK